MFRLIEVVEPMQQLSVSAVLLYCIVAAAVLIYLPFLVVAYGRVRAGYDIAAPRALFDQLPAYAQRATWAHQNSFESFMLFAAAALMAVVTQVDAVWASYAAIAYVSARLLYSLFYILNLPVLRSLMFGIGSAGIATLMSLSLGQLS
jgi:uncharacterized MAPEG superfamily protein